MDAPSPIHSTVGRPLVYGHRGASAYARDNTVESIALAVEQGADGVEVDVRATRDGRLILHHDDREPGFEPLGQLDFVQVRRDLPFIPTLDEAWGALGDTAYMNIEVKVDETDSHRGDRLIGDVVDWIATRDVADRVVLSSFDAWTTRQVRELARRQAIEAEIQSYDEELLSYDERSDLLAAEREQAARRLAQAEQHSRLWQEAVNDRRRIEAERDARAAQDAAGYPSSNGLTVSSSAARNRPDMKLAEPRCFSFKRRV